MKIQLLFFLFIIIPLFGFSQSPQLQQIELKSMSGERTTMETVVPKGKPVILSFWATWCAPCKKELDAISGLYSDWQNKYDVTLLAISTDDARTAGRLKSTVAQKNWPFEVYHDTEGQSRQVFSFSSIPFTVVLDNTGKVVYSHIGYSSGDENKLEELLAKMGG